jgi:FixJ family two-component response regulator
MAAVSGASLIACVEDDPAVREAVEGLLVALGFTTAVFSSAEAFLQSSRLVDTSCLITDVRLGGMSGLELQNSLATSGYRIPTIVVTAFPDDRTRTQALGAGAVGVLSKPITKEELLTCLGSALRGAED